MCQGRREEISILKMTFFQEQGYECQNIMQFQGNYTLFIFEKHVFGLFTLPLFPYSMCNILRSSFSLVISTNFDDAFHSVVVCAME